MSASSLKVFDKGDLVEWKRGPAVHRGSVVAIVPPGEYPEKLVPGCREYGQQRPHKSYVIQDLTGKRYWPRMMSLRLVQRAVQA